MKVNTKWLFGILAIVFIAMLPVMKTAFINYDDDIYLIDNLLITRFDIKGLFSAVYEGQYSPVAMTLGAIQYKLFGTNPQGYKFFSILIHVLNTLLVYLFVYRLTTKEKWAAITAILFGLHPMQMESVAWAIASLKIGTYVLFFLAACLTYLKYLDKDQSKYLIYTAVLFLLSAMCKEQAIALVPTLFLLDYYKGRSLKTAKVWVEKIPMIIIGFIFGYITLSASSGHVSKQIIFDYSFVDRLVFTFYTFGVYAIKMFIPYKLSFFYTYPIQGQTPFYFYLIGLLPFAVFYFLWKAIKSNNRVVVFAILFFVFNVFLTLFSQILSVRDVLMADRYVYLPIIGGFVILAYLVEKFETEKPNLKYVPFAMAAIFAGMSFQRIKVFTDSETVFTDAINKEKYNKGQNPFLALPYNNRAIALKRKGKIPAAEQDYLSSIISNPDYANGYLNLGNIYFDRNQTEQALGKYEKAIELDATSYKAWSGKAAVHGRLAELNMALESINKALEIKPDFADGLQNRGFVYYSKRDYTKAIIDFEKYLTLKPNDDGIYSALGHCYMNTNQDAKALDNLNKAIRINANVANHYVNRAVYYQNKGQVDLMKKDAATARSLGKTRLPDGM